MKTPKRLLSLLLVLTLAFGLCGGALAAETGDVVVLYTNDVHTYITEDLTYSLVSAYKASLGNALLVDAGDAIQGTAYGSMDQGKTMIQLMNTAGYDLATLGNHEFDYGMAGCMQAIAQADFPYVSCNFYHEAGGVRGENVLDSYKVFEVNGVKLAFVGITTPESFSKSTPAYFQDENGNYIYGIAGGADGSELYAAVQAAIDAAAAEADYVIALGHLGVDPSSRPWTSEEVIANTTGLDAFIDGHSQTVMESEQVTDKGGNTVILTQTGEYLGALGQLTIAADGTITTELLTAQDLAGITPDPTVKALEDAWVQEIDAQLGQVIGSIDDTLDNYDAEGDRLVRRQETNTGDFAADALYYLFDSMGMDVDVAVMNGGGIRNGAITGEISYLTCKEIHTFGNVACLQTVTGQQLLDALEWGAKDVTADGLVENGGFLQVSGLKYTIDTTIPSTVQQDEKGVWTGGPTGAYRVTDVQVLDRETGTYVPLDLDKSYNLAGYNYTLRDLGDGFAMFDGAVNVLDYVMEDYMVLANYVQSFENGKVTGYGDVNGDGRITIRTAADAGLYTDVSETSWYAGAVAYVTEQGLMNGVGGGAFAPETPMTRAMLVTMLYNLEGKPAPEDGAETGFSDVAADTWYADAVAWASENQIVTGMGDGSFAPTAELTREQMAVMLYNWAAYRQLTPTGAWMIQLDYTDLAEISDWAVTAVTYCALANILEGADGAFDPLGAASRAQGAAVLMRLDQMLAA